MRFIKIIHPSSVNSGMLVELENQGCPLSPEVPGFTPSGYVVPGKKVAHEMSHDEIKELIEVYAEDAKICEEIGFDGVEIHGAHGYLIDQFFWDQN